MDVVDAHRDVIRGNFNGILQKELGMVQHAQPFTDFGELTHSLNMMRHFLEKLPADILSLEQTALSNQVDYSHHRFRCRLQSFELCLHPDRAGILALGTQNIELSAPTGLKRRVDRTALA